MTWKPAEMFPVSQPVTVPVPVPVPYLEHSHVPTTRS